MSIDTINELSNQTLDISILSEWGPAPLTPIHHSVDSRDQKVTDDESVTNDSIDVQKFDKDIELPSIHLDPLPTQSDREHDQQAIAPHSSAIPPLRPASPSNVTSPWVSTPLPVHLISPRNKLLSLTPHPSRFSSTKASSSPVPFRKAHSSQVLTQKNPPPLLLTRSQEIPQLVVHFISAYHTPIKKRDKIHLSKGNPYFVAAIVPSSQLSPLIPRDGNALSVSSFSPECLSQILDAQPSVEPTLGGLCESPSVNISSPIRFHPLRRNQKAIRRWIGSELTSAVKNCIGQSVRSETLFNCRNPQWFAIRDMGADPRPDDNLVILLYTWGKGLMHQLLCYLVIPVATLTMTATVQQMKMLSVKDLGGYSDCMFSLEWKPNVPPFLRKKTIFFIRHGESKWNEAQKKKRKAGSMAQFDHPLNRAGIDQAQGFRSRWFTCFQDAHQKQIISSKEILDSDSSSCSSILSRDSMIPRPLSPSSSSSSPSLSFNSSFPTSLSSTSLSSTSLSSTSLTSNSSSRKSLREEQFLRAQKIFCSPLTRALQTAFLGLYSHPALQRSNPIILLPSLREIKKLGGLDTVGKEYGAKIPKRALKQLHSCLSERELLQYDSEILSGVDSSRCSSTWWSKLITSESKLALKRRYFDLISSIFLDKSSDSVICVGHSLFIQHFVSLFISPDLQLQKPTLSKNLVSKKLNNTSCLAIDVVFSPDPNLVRIIDAELIFGSSFH